MNKALGNVDYIFGKWYYRDLDDDKQMRIARDILEAVVLDESLDEVVKERILFLADETTKFLHEAMKPTCNDKCPESRDETSSCRGCPLLEYCQKSSSEESNPHHRFLDENGDLPF